MILIQNCEPRKRRGEFSSTASTYKSTWLTQSGMKDIVYENEYTYDFNTIGADLSLFHAATGLNGMGMRRLVLF